MKKILLMSLLSFLIGSSLYATNALEGEIFERTFESQPLGAPTPMQFTHTLSFQKNWVVVDNSSTWFGNPPNQCAYGVEWTKDKHAIGRVTVICNGSVTRFQYVKKGDSAVLKGKAIALTQRQKSEL